jgi:hypothetical protein
MSELGSGSGTSYPASLDVDNSVEVDSSTTARADVPNDLAAAIIAVQNELGTDPAGSLSNVKTFLQTEHSTNGTHGDLTVGSLTLSKSLRLKQGADVASASDLAIDIDGNLFDVTGTTTINTMRTKGIGTSVVLQFDGACQLTYDATNFFIPGKANYTTAAGDVFMFYEYASADWRCTGYALANGKAIIETAAPSSATTTAEGLVEIATQAEVNTGTDTTRSITPATLAGASLGGKILQIVNTQYSSVGTTTSAVAHDDSIPQNTEGGEFMTRAITPTASDSTLHILVVCHAGYTNVGLSASLFVDSTASALATAYAGVNAAGMQATLNFRYVVSAASTSSRTYKVRGAANGSGTFTFNGDASSRKFGTSIKSSMTIYEVGA